MKKALIAAAALAASMVSAAQDSTFAPTGTSLNVYEGAKLLVALDDGARNQSPEEQLEMMWVMGWLDGIETTLNATGIEARGIIFCDTERPSGRELAHLYVSYFASHQHAARQFAAIKVLSDALREKYPCKS